MSGGHVFVSFQRFMENLFGDDGSKIDDIVSTASEISSLIFDLGGGEEFSHASEIRAELEELNDTLATLTLITQDIDNHTENTAEHTERNKQNAGGKLRIAVGTTSGATTTITPSPAPTDNESIRIRHVYFTPEDNPFPVSTRLGFFIDNTSGGEAGFRWETTRSGNAFPIAFELGDWYHEITTSSFRIRRHVGGANVQYYIGYTIQDTEGALP